jgi:predicted  nucleic acid-binding Zn-ribbon protein
MVYICEKCSFVFERTGEIFSCPDCGRPDIREASEQEDAEYRKTRPAFAGDAGLSKERGPR